MAKTVGRRRSVVCLGMVWPGKLLGRLMLVLGVWAFKERSHHWAEGDEAMERVVRMFATPEARRQRDELGQRWMETFRRGRPAIPDPEPEPGTVRMRDAKGGSWLCRLPSAKEDASSEAAQKRDRVSEDGRPPEASARAFESLRSAATECATAPQRAGQYWGYEVCVGRFVRQFRLVAAGPQQKQGSPPSLARNADATHRLGEFDARGKSGDAVPVRRYASIDELRALFTNSTFSEYDGVATWPTTPQMAIVDEYPNGDDGRRATTYAACVSAETEVRNFATSSSKMAERARQQAKSDMDIYGPSIRIVKVVEKPELHYHVLLAAPALLCSKTDYSELAVNRETKLLRGACLLYKPPGWWTYEVCVGKSVRQFRAGQSAENTNHKDDRPGFTIGLFKNDTATTQHHLLRPFEPPFPARLHVYDRGDVCDLTGERRSARVFFRCDQTLARGLAGADARKGPSVVSIYETSTCNYEILVNLPAVCSLRQRDDLAAAAPFHNIDCHLEMMRVPPVSPEFPDLSSSDVCADGDASCTPSSGGGGGGGDSSYPSTRPGPYKGGWPGDPYAGYWW